MLTKLRKKIVWAVEKKALNHSDSTDDVEHITLVVNQGGEEVGWGGYKERVKQTQVATWILGLLPWIRLHTNVKLKDGKSFKEFTLTKRHVASWSHA